MTRRSHLQSFKNGEMFVDYYSSSGAAYVIEASEKQHFKIISLIEKYIMRRRRKSVPETYVTCPLLKRDISIYDCYDICMVMEEMATVETVLEDVRPIVSEENRQKCLRCKNHCE